MPKKKLPLNFTHTLNAFKEKAEEIKKLNGTVASNPQHTLKCISEFSALAKALNDLLIEMPKSSEKAKSQSAINQARTKEFNGMLARMEFEAKKAIDSEKKTEERNKRLFKERDELQANAKQTYDDNFPKLQRLANAFLAKANDREALYAEYKELQAVMRAAINNMSPEQRSPSGCKLNELSHQVNVFKEQLDRTTADEQTKAQIKRLVERAARSVEGMSALKILQLIAPAATKLQITQIMERQQALALTQEHAEHHVENGTLLSILTNPLNLALTKSDSVMGQFIAKISNDIDELRKGKKTHLSVLVNVDGAVQVTHIDIRTLLNNPQQVISEMAFAMYKAGVKDHDMAIILSTPAEVASTSLLQGRTVATQSVAELTQHVLSATTDNNALSASAEESFDKRDNALSTEEVTEVVKAVATIFEARAMLKANTPAPVITSREIELASIPSVAPAAVPVSAAVSAPVAVEPTIVPQPIPESVPVSTPPTQPPQAASTTTPNVSPAEVPVKRFGVKELKKEFLTQLDKLVKLNDEFQLKSITNKNYQQVATQSKTLVAALTSSAVKLFGNELTGEKTTLASLQEMREFTSSCKHAIRGAEDEFKKHRGVWHKEVHPIIKAILGVLATLTVIPALVFTASEQGYKNTFFASPKTNSAKILADVERKVDLIGQYEELIRTEAPGAA